MSDPISACVPELRDIPGHSLATGGLHSVIHWLSVCLSVPQESSLDWSDVEQALVVVEARKAAASMTATTTTDRRECVGGKISPDMNAASVMETGHAPSTLMACVCVYTHSVCYVRACMHDAVCCACGHQRMLAGYESVSTELVDRLTGWLAKRLTDRTDQLTEWLTGRQACR